MYYILKYISKSEQSLYSKLAIAASVRTAQMSLSPMNTVTGKKMVQQIYNKIESHREVGIPEAISHLLEFPDHYTDASFVNISMTQLLHHFKYLNQLFLNRYLSQTDIDMEDDEEQLDGEIVNIDHTYHLITYFDDYQYRGHSLDSYCLYDYCSIYHKVKSNNGLPFTSDHPQHHRYSQIMRANWTSVIPNLLGTLTYLNSTLKDVIERENYFCLITALFIPWTPETVRKPQEMTWEEYFHHCAVGMSARLHRYIDNLCLLHKSREESRLDRLQRPSSTEIPPFMRADSDDDDSEDEDANDESNDFMTIPHSEEDFIAQVMAIRHAENSMDFYTLEVINACYDHGYFKETPSDSSDDSTSPQYLCMHSKSVK